MNMFNRHSLKAAMLLAGAISTGPALSHNPLDDPEWCQGDSTTVIVAEFAWSGEAIILSDEQAVCSVPRRTVLPDDGTCDVIPPTHGYFDDDWYRVQTKIDLYCGQFTVSYDESSNPDHGTVVGIATEPNNFADEEDHHDLYIRNQGVQGACVRCEPVVPPVSPPPVSR